MCEKGARARCAAARDHNKPDGKVLERKRLVGVRLATETLALSSLPTYNISNQALWLTTPP